MKQGSQTAQAFKPISRELGEQSQTLWLSLGQKVTNVNEENLLFTSLQGLIAELQKLADLQSEFYADLTQEMQGLAQEVSQGYAFARIGEELDLFSSSSTTVRAGHDMGFTTVAVDMHFTSSRLDEREGVRTEVATGLNSTSNKKPSQKAREQSSLEETGSSREFVTEKRTVESKDAAALEQANCEVFKSRSLFDTHHTAKGESGGVARDKSATMGTKSSSCCTRQ